MIDIYKKILAQSWEPLSPGGTLEVQDHIDNPNWKPYQSNKLWYGLRSDVWNGTSKWEITFKVEDYILNLNEVKWK